MLFIKNIFLAAIIFFAVTISSVIAQDLSYKNYNVEQGLPSSEVYRVIQDSKGYIWFATDGGVCRFDGTSFKTYTTKDGLCDNTILHLFEDSKGRIWCYSFSGKLSYFKNDSIYNLSVNEKLANIYRYYDVSSLYVDDKDTIWMGLLGKGLLYKLSVDGGYMGINEKDTLGKTKNVFIKKFKESEFILASTLGKQNIDKLFFYDENNRLIIIPIPKTYYTHSLRMSFVKLKDNDYLISMNNVIILFNEHGTIQRKELNDKVISFYEDKQENIWVGVYGQGVVKIEKKDRQKLDYKIYLKGKSVSDIREDKEGGFWFTTLDEGVFYTSSVDFSVYDRKNGFTSKIYSFTLNGRGNRLVTVFQNRDIFEINIPKNEIHKIETANYIPTRSAHFDTKDNLWIGCFGNVIVLNDKKKIIKSFKNGGGTCYYNDKDTILEGSTDGIHNYYKFKYNYGKCNYKGNLKVNGICRRDSIIFVGSLNGLWNVTNKGLNYIGNTHPLFKNRINDIKIDKKKNLWMASKGAGVIVYSNDNKVYQITEKQGLVNDLCNAISIDSIGQVWVGTNNGLSKIIPIQGVIQNYTIENYNTSNGLVSNQITQMALYKNDLWLGTNSGLTVFNSTQLKLNVVPAPIYINSVSANEKTISVKITPTFSHSNNNIEFSYSGLAYKNAGKIRYKYILDGLDTNNVYTTSNVVRFAELPYGAYTFKVWACNNDGMWSSEPATFLFIIKPAFYQTWWFLSIMVLLGIGLVIMIVRFSNKRIREKGELTQKITESEQKALRAQMNPHFIFNSLNSIQKFIMKNDKLLASDYLSKFSNLMRAILDNSQELYIPLEDELNSLKLYMELESLRFENKFDYVIDVDEEIDVYSTEIPSMLIQPYVENAIKHGLSSNDLKGDIKIIVNKEKDGILYTIKDNGIGREKAAVLKVVNHRSHGLKITQERIDALNMYRKHKITLEIIDLYTPEKIASGTQVDLYIPDRL